MAEIKSTLELALERLKKITISEGEKEEIKKKEILAKATGMFNRYMEDFLSVGDLLREIERLEGKAGTMTREFLLSQAIGAISLEKDNEKLLRAVESLKGRGVEDARQKLASFRSKYEKRKEEAEEEMRVRMREGLRKDGIPGSAVVPRLHPSDEWEKNVERLQQTFQKKIDEIKEDLRKL